MPSSKDQRVAQAITYVNERHDLGLSDNHKTFITEAVMEALAPGARHFPRHGDSPLNSREIGILAGCARGLTNAQIAEELRLSPLTIKSHLTRIGSRVGYSERAGLVGEAYRKGWMTHLRPEEHPIELLTVAEQEVLERMALGTANADIARQIYLSEEAVKSRIRKIFAKLGATNRAHAVAIGYQQGLLTVPQHEGVAA